MTTVDLVVNYLRALQERGTATLPVDDEARAVLREWMLAARRGVRKPAPAPMHSLPPAGMNPPAPGSAPSPAPAPAANAQATPEPQDVADVASYLRAAMHEDNEPQQEQQEEEAVPFFRPGGSSADEVWENFHRMLPNWRPLRDLGTLRSVCVPPMGNRQADIMFVGDAPTYPDETERRTFAGAAGEKLDGMLKAMGLTREQVYITHLVKFRPGMPRQTTNNRPPSEKEMLYSRSIVELETRLVQPKVIVALGVITARGLLQRGDLPLAAYQQQGGNFCGVPVVVCHHPSYLLRTNDITERRRLWEEMLRVMEMTGLPISDKQRGYFLKK